ncbi:MAG: O-antigen ligase family protein [Gammaproteobacteria bacterium]|nr:O-antigen ligase family protein [Gammaproteobacteria bacterium]
MQLIARMAILAFVFTIPWENMIVIPGFGTISKLTGIVAFSLGFVAFLLQPQLRNFKAFHVLFLSFVMYSAISYVWTVDNELSLDRIRSNFQLVLFVWLIWQFLETERHVLQAIQFYVLGSVVGAVATLVAYLAGVQSSYMRYSAEGFDPNELSVFLAIAIPMAWYLSMRHQTVWLVWLNRLLIAALLIAILLTGSRTGLVVACVGITFILITMSRGSTGAKISVGLLLIVGAIALPQVIPESTWARLATLEEELASGTLNNRTNIWSAGLSIWLNNLAFGVGAGAFRTATHINHGFVAAPHNTFLSILVELGAVGFMLFGAIMYVVWKKISEMPYLERWLYLSTCIILMLGLFTLTWETKKPLWLLGSLILCHAMALVEPYTQLPDEKSDISVSETPSRLLQLKNKHNLLSSKPRQLYFADAKKSKL